MTQADKTRILVVDDDDQILKVLEQLLEFAGYDVVKASNGNEATRIYREAQPDLIITDLIMPEKDGLEVIGDIKRDFPDAKIIAISGGNPGSKYLNEAGRLGASRTIRKPFHANDILEAIRDLLEPLQCTCNSNLPLFQGSQDEFGEV